MVTFARASSEGMVNEGTERFTLTSEVTLLMALMAVEITWLAELMSAWMELRMVFKEEVIPSEICRAACVPDYVNFRTGSSDRYAACSQSRRPR